MSALPALVVERDSRPDGVAVFSLGGELVVTNREVLRDAAESEIANGARSLVIAVDRLTHIDTSGLALLVRLAGKCAESGGRLAVAGLKSDFLEMRQHLYLDEALLFADDVTGAVVAVAAPR
jgi:anti-anti-sigma factor